MTTVERAPEENLPVAGGRRAEGTAIGGAAGAAPSRRWPGLLAAAAGLGGAVLAHRLAPAIGVLTWAVVLSRRPGPGHRQHRPAAAVVVKLTRLLLAPLAATVSARRRLTGAGQDTAAKRPPIVPLFVLGFLACVALRSTGLVPTGALTAISYVQVAALGAALFGMGAAVHIRSFVPRQRPRPARLDALDAAGHGRRVGRGRPAGWVMPRTGWRPAADGAGQP